MSDPSRPDPSSSPTRDRHVTPYRDSPSRRRRDIETGAYVNPPYNGPTSPGLYAGDRDPIIAHTHGNHSDLGRKKSLVRPERRRVDKNDLNFHYRQHAQHMDVHPSTTGNDPILEEPEFERRTISSESTNLKDTVDDALDYDDDDLQKARLPEKALPVGRKKTQRKLARKETRQVPMLTDEEKRRLKRQEELNRPPSAWNVYCSVITFWAPDFLLKCFGMPAKPQRRAWREKMGLISIILVVAAFVGFLTFGFTEAVCRQPGLRLQINNVDTGYMIFHGDAYNLVESAHPAALGIPLGSNVLYDLPHKYGGQDGSFLFQQVNGACQDLITLAPGSDVPTNENGDLAWYFPCIGIAQDGSTPANNSGSYYPSDYYNGYACHTTSKARSTFYGLVKSGEVYFTWDDVRNTSRNLFVYSGAVVDLDLIRFFNKSQVVYPTQFDDMRSNPEIRGLDMTHVLQSQADKRLATCMSQIMKVGNIDTESVGCIASKVVLYVSLVFILSIVVSKFVLALLFQWILCRRYGAAKTSQSSDPKKRAKQIEEWSDDIYKQPPRLTEPASTAPGSDGRTSKRASTLFPQTSRFTSPYAVDRGSKVTNKYPTTMVTQTNGARPVSTVNNLYRPSFNASQGSTLDIAGSRYSLPPSANRSSLMLNDHRFSQAMSDVEGPGPEGFIHEHVVPQPPPEWQPYGYPLCHTLCMVTAYSEGEDAIRTTLNSIATTDYPNSHKCLVVICDGMVKGKGEVLTTPEIVLTMMGDFAVAPEDVHAFSYVAVATGSKRHNMAKIHAGFYDYGENSPIPVDKQQRVPMILITKCGTPSEAGKAKPGNRGKRDSQIILMSFLQKVMFDERMTELEYEMFNGIWKVTGMSPDFYETVLCVDADTKIFPDSLTHMNSAMVSDPEVMGLCGETKIANKRVSWVTMIQVFEYFISHHLAKSFESVFGGVTCLPGCFSMYRIKSPKGGQNYWVPILANPDIVERYSENVVETLHDKNLLLLGEDRYLSTLMLRTFPKRKQVFIPQAVCKTTVPETFSVLLSQRRRWINSTIHNLMELVLVRDLCGTFCFSMQFVVFIELVGTLVLPAAISFTVYLIVISIVRKPVPIIPLVLLALVLGLPGVLIVMTAHRWSYLLWMSIYLLSLPIWNFVLPVYSYWKFDDFSWGETRQTDSDVKTKGAHDIDGEFDSSKITMKRWGDFERERRIHPPGTMWHMADSKPAFTTYESHETLEPYSDY